VQKHSNVRVDVDFGRCSALWGLIRAIILGQSAKLGEETMKVGAKGVQIFLLVLLLVAGGGAYLWQQGTDFDSLIDDAMSFVGAEPAKPVVTASPPPPVNPIPPIPQQPASGAIGSSAFTVAVAEIQGGTLTLRGGADARALEVRLHLQPSPWEVPVGRNFQFVNATANAPVVRVRWFDAEQKAPRERQYTEKYTLRVELGQEQDRKIPGKIYLLLPDEAKSRIAGTFTAEVRGFRLVNGKPDLSSDSVDTLQYLALRELLKDDPDRPVKELSFYQARYSDGRDNMPPVGYLELTYQIGDDAKLMTRKFQFVKENQVWRVRGTLKPDQLNEAHPIKVPTAKDGPEHLFPYLAAQRIEAGVQKRAPGKLITATDFVTRYSDPHKIGVSEITYRVGEEPPVQASYLFVREKAGWTLKRELNQGERLNLATGKIEKRR
jgi:hypothetical protein